jgi:hypothetical protein
MKLDKKEIWSIGIILFTPLVLTLIIRYGLSSLYTILPILFFYVLTLIYATYRLILRIYHFIEEIFDKKDISKKK